MQLKPASTLAISLTLIFIILNLFDNISSDLTKPSGISNLSFMRKELAAPSSPIGNSIKL